MGVLSLLRQRGQDFSADTGLVKRFRAAQKDRGVTEERSTRDITEFLGRKLQADGRFDEVGGRESDFRNAFLDIEHQDLGSAPVEFFRGIEQGARGLFGTALGFGALAAEEIDDFFGDGTFLESLVRDPLLKRAQEQFEKASAEGATVKRFEDIRNLSEAVGFVSAGFGQALPSIGEALISGGVGGAIGKTIVKRTVKNSIRKRFGSEVAKRKAAAEAKIRALGSTASKAERDALIASRRLGSQEVFDALQAEIKEQGIRTGVNTSVLLNSYALSAGEIYADLAADPEIGPEAAGVAALMFGGIAALPDTILPSIIVNRMFRNARIITNAQRKAGASYVQGAAKKLEQKLGTRAVKGLLVGSATEGPTEGFQEFTNIVASRWQKGISSDLTQAEISQILNAGALGAIGGGGVTTLASLPRPPTPPPADEILDTALNKLTRGADDNEYTREEKLAIRWFSEQQGGRAAIESLNKTQTKKVRPANPDPQVADDPRNQQVITLAIYKQTIGETLSPIEAEALRINAEENIVDPETVGAQSRINENEGGLDAIVQDVAGNITPEAAQFIDNVDNTNAVPTEMSPLLVRIAKENDIIIDDNTSPRDVVNELRRKRDEKAPVSLPVEVAEAEQLELNLPENQTADTADKAALEVPIGVTNHQSTWVLNAQIADVLFASPIDKALYILTKRGAQASASAKAEARQFIKNTYGWTDEQIDESAKLVGTHVVETAESLRDAAHAGDPKIIVRPLYSTPLNVQSGSPEFGDNNAGTNVDPESGVAPLDGGKPIVTADQAAEPTPPDTAAQELLSRHKLGQNEVTETYNKSIQTIARLRTELDRANEFGTPREQTAALKRLQDSQEKHKQKFQTDPSFPFVFDSSLSNRRILDALDTGKFSWINGIGLVAVKPKKTVEQTNEAALNKAKESLPVRAAAPVEQTAIIKDVAVQSKGQGVSIDRITGGLEEEGGPTLLEDIKPDPISPTDVATVTPASAVTIELVEEDTVVNDDRAQGRKYSISMDGKVVAGVIVSTPKDVKAALSNADDLLPQIEFIEIFDDFQGRGLSNAIYRGLIDEFGGIRSDSIFLSAAVPQIYRRLRDQGYQLREDESGRIIVRPPKGQPVEVSKIEDEPLTEAETDALEKFKTWKISVEQLPTDSPLLEDDEIWQVWKDARIERGLTNDNRQPIVARNLIESQPKIDEFIRGALHSGRITEITNLLGGGDLSDRSVPFGLLRNSMQTTNPGGIQANAPIPLSDEDIIQRIQEASANNQLVEYYLEVLPRVIYSAETQSDPSIAEKHLNRTLELGDYRVADQVLFQGQVGVVLSIDEGGVNVRLMDGDVATADASDLVITKRNGIMAAPTTLPIPAAAPLPDAGPASTESTETPATTTIEEEKGKPPPAVAPPPPRPIQRIVQPKTPLEEKSPTTDPTNPIALEVDGTFQVFERIPEDANVEDVVTQKAGVTDEVKKANPKLKHISKKPQNTRNAVAVLDKNTGEVKIIPVWRDKGKAMIRGNKKVRGKGFVGVPLKSTILERDSQQILGYIHWESNIIRKTITFANKKAYESATKHQVAVVPTDKRAQGRSIGEINAQEFALFVEQKTGQLLDNMPAPLNNIIDKVILGQPVTAKDAEINPQFAKDLKVLRNQFIAQQAISKGVQISALEGFDPSNKLEEDGTVTDSNSPDSQSAPDTDIDFDEADRIIFNAEVDMLDEDQIIDQLTNIYGMSVNEINDVLEGIEGNPTNTNANQYIFDNIATQFKNFASNIRESAGSRRSLKDHLTQTANLIQQLARIKNGRTAKGITGSVPSSAGQLRKPEQEGGARQSPIQPALGGIGINTIPEPNRAPPKLGTDRHFKIDTALPRATLRTGESASPALTNRGADAKEALRVLLNAAARIAGIESKPVATENVEKIAEGVTQGVLNIEDLTLQQIRNAPDDQLGKLHDILEGAGISLDDVWHQIDESNILDVYPNLETVARAEGIREEDFIDFVVSSNNHSNQSVDLDEAIVDLASDIQDILDGGGGDIDAIMANFEINLLANVKARADPLFLAAAPSVIKDSQTLKDLVKRTEANGNIVDGLFELYAENSGETVNEIRLSQLLLAELDGYNAGTSVAELMQRTEQASLNRATATGLEQNPPSSVAGISKIEELARPRLKGAASYVPFAVVREIESRGRGAGEQIEHLITLLTSTRTKNPEIYEWLEKNEPATIPVLDELQKLLPTVEISQADEMISDGVGPEQISAITRDMRDNMLETEALENQLAEVALSGDQNAQILLSQQIAENQRLLDDMLLTTSRMLELLISRYPEIVAQIGDGAIRQGKRAFRKAYVRPLDSRTFTAIQIRDLMNLSEQLQTFAENSKLLELRELNPNSRTAQSVPWIERTKPKFIYKMREASAIALNIIPRANLATGQTDPTVLGNFRVKKNGISPLNYEIIDAIETALATNQTPNFMSSEVIGIAVSPATRAKLIIKQPLVSGTKLDPEFDLHVDLLEEAIERDMGGFLLRATNQRSAGNDVWKHSFVTTNGRGDWFIHLDVNTRNAYLTENKGLLAFDSISRKLDPAEIQADPEIKAIVDKWNDENGRNLRGLDVDLNGSLPEGTQAAVSEQKDKVDFQNQIQNKAAKRLTSIEGINKSLEDNTRPPRTRVSQMLGDVVRAFPAVSKGSLEAIRNILRLLEDSSIESGRYETFANMRIVVSTVPPQSPDFANMSANSAGGYSVSTNILWINPSERIQHRDVFALVFLHESGHFFVEHVLGFEVATAAWHSLTIEQRARAFVQYRNTHGDNLKVSEINDADIINNREAIHEWGAMTYTRIVAGGISNVDKTVRQLKREGITDTILGPIIKFIQSLKDFVRKWMADETLSDVDIDNVFKLALGLPVEPGIQMPNFTAKDAENALKTGEAIATRYNQRDAESRLAFLRQRANAAGVALPAFVDDAPAFAAANADYRLGNPIPSMAAAETFGAVGAGALPQRLINQKNAQVLLNAVNRPSSSKRDRENVLNPNVGGHNNPEMVLQTADAVSNELRSILNLKDAIGADDPVIAAMSLEQFWARYIDTPITPDQAQTFLNSKGIPFSRKTFEEMKADEPDRARSVAFHTAREHNENWRHNVEKQRAEVDVLAQYETQLDQLEALSNETEVELNDAKNKAQQARRQLISDLNGLKRNLRGKGAQLGNLGRLGAIINQLEGQITEPVARQYVKAIEKLLANTLKNELKFFDLIEAVAASGIDIRNLSASAIQKQFAQSSNPVLKNLAANNKPDFGAVLSLLKGDEQLLVDILTRKLPNLKAKVALIEERIAIYNDRATDASSNARLGATTTAAESRLFGRLQTKAFQARAALARKRNQIEALKGNIRTRERLITEFARLQEEYMSEFQGTVRANMITGSQILDPATDNADWGDIVSNAKRFSLKKGEIIASEEWVSIMRRQREWLDNEENKVNPWDYHVMETQYRKMRELQAERMWHDTRALISKWYPAPFSFIFKRLGTAIGNNLNRQVQKYQTLVEALRRDAERLGDKAAIAREKLLRATGLIGTGFDEAQAFIDVIDTAAKYNLEQEGTSFEAMLDFLMKTSAAPMLQTAEAKRRLKEYLEAEQEFSVWVKNTSASLDLGVTDDRILTYDPTMPLDQQGSLSPIERMHLNIGTGNFMVKANSDRVNRIVDVMRERWGNPTEFINILNLYQQGEQDAANQAVRNLFKDQDGVIQRHFLDALVKKDKTPVFFKQTGSDKLRQIADTSDIIEAWNSANGDVVTFMRNLYENTTPDVSTETFSEYVMSTLVELKNTYYKSLEGEADSIGAAADSSMTPTSVQHVGINARKNDLWPSHWLQYRQSTKRGNVIVAETIAFHAAFGKDGAEFFDNVQSQKEEFEGDKDILDVVTDHARAFKAANQSATKAEVKAEMRRKAAEELGMTNGDVALRRLQRAQDKWATVDRAEKAFKGIFQNELGPTQEMGVVMEAISFIVKGILNGVRAALVQLNQVMQPFLFFGFSRTSFQQAFDQLRFLGKDMFGSMIQALGGQLDNNNEEFNLQRELFGADADIGNPFWGSILSDYGKQNELRDPSIRNRARRFFNIMNNFMSRGYSRVDANNALYTAFKPWAPFAQLQTGLNRGAMIATRRSFNRLAMRAIKFYKDNPDLATDPNYKIKRGDVGMTETEFDRFTSILNHDVGITLDALARDVIRTGAEKPFTDEQYKILSVSGLGNLASESNFFTTRPTVLAQGAGKFMFPLLGWAIQQPNNFLEAFKNPITGEVNRQSLMSAMVALGAGVLPMGLTLAFFVDWWDEEIMGKRSNLRPMYNDTGEELTIGDLLGGTDIVPDFLGDLSVPAATERMIRSGIAGIPFELLNLIINLKEEGGDVRTLSLDQRIMLAGLVRNFVSTIGVMSSQGIENSTWVSVGRPLVQSFGFNGIMQNIDMLDNLLELDNPESRGVRRSNVGNYIRTAGRAVNLEMRKGSQAFPTPEPHTPWVSQMIIAAYSNDRTQFIQSWRRALQEAKEAGKPDPVKTVTRSYASRHPLRASFTGKLTFREWQKALSVMSDGGKKIVGEALRMYDNYGAMIDVKPFSFESEVGRPKKKRVAQARGTSPFASRRGATPFSSGRSVNPFL